MTTGIDLDNVISTVAISAIRIKWLNLDADGTYNNVDAATWTVGELSCGMIVSCLPCLRPVLFKFFPQMEPTPNSTDKTQVQTIGGGYSGGSNSRRPGGLKNNRRDLSSKSQRQESSTEGFARLDDIEMGIHT
jgi:hypothetical protein